MNSKVPTEGIVTDGSHLSKSGITQYRVVSLKMNEELFRIDLGNQTVNIGEFLGVVHAAKYIIENDFQPKIIYTDSMTAITWFNNKQASSKKNIPELRKAEVFLKAFSCEIDKIELRHWSSEHWGESPADFGYK